MRLLNTSTLEFQSFADNDRPPYAIASHRWRADESTFKDFQQKRNVLAAGHRKVLGFCGLVERMNTHAGPSRALNDLGLRHRCEWLWIDTCCINKEDGAELSESINSMFRWYGDAAVCYVYLWDVLQNQKYNASTLDLTRSEWFERGWTLQELIAPRTVVFLANNWDVLGHKCAYSEQMSLEWPSINHLRNVSVEQKMSWTERRSTTRIEDQAYCLLGLLDVFISPIYGEGEYAWTRLMQQLAYNQSAKFPAPGAKSAKKSQMWFRLKQVKKNIVEKGRFATQTTVSAEISGHGTMSISTLGTRASGPEPPRGQMSLSALDSRASGPDPSLAQWSMSALESRAHSGPDPPRGQMSMPALDSRAHSGPSYALRVPMSVPPRDTPALHPLPTHVAYRSNGTDPLQYIAGFASLKGPPRFLDPQKEAVVVQPKGLPMPLEYSQETVKATQGSSFFLGLEDLSLPPPAAELKHRYGSGWSFHNADGYEPVWYHELPGAVVSRENQYPHNDEKIEKAREVKARFNFRPSAPGQLAFDKGDILVVLESFHEHWWKGSLRGKTGIFPGSCVDGLDTPSEEERGQRKTQSNAEANVSTLAAGEEPGLDDWERHDARSPGAWSDVQSQLVSGKVDKAVHEERQSMSQSGKIKAGESREEPVKASSTLIRSSVRRKPVRRATPFRKEDVDDEKEDDQVRGSVDSPRLMRDLTEEQLNALPEGLRQAFVSDTRTGQIYTELSTLMYKSSSPTKSMPAELEEQTVGPVGFIESDQSALEEDASSIQSEHFESPHWRESVEVVKPEKPAGAEATMEVWPNDPQKLEISHEEKAGVFVKSTDVLTASEEDQNITIPRVVLRALLDPAAVANNADTPNQTAQLANTAVEYIRSLLLSQSGANLPPVQQTTTTVEAYRFETSRFETSKYQQHVSVAESVSTVVGDSSSSLDGSEEFGSIRRQGTAESWHLHGVWAESG